MRVFISLIVFILPLIAVHEADAQRFEDCTGLHGERSKIQQYLINTELEHASDQGKRIRSYKPRDDKHVALLGELVRTNASHPIVIHMIIENKNRLPISALQAYEPRLLFNVFCENCILDDRHSGNYRAAMLETIKDHEINVFSYTLLSLKLLNMRSDFMYQDAMDLLCELKQKKPTWRHFRETMKNGGRIEKAIAIYSMATGIHPTALAMSRLKELLTTMNLKTRKYALHLIMHLELNHAWFTDEIKLTLDDEQARAIHDEAYMCLLLRDPSEENQERVISIALKDRFMSELALKRLLQTRITEAQYSRLYELVYLNKALKEGSLSRRILLDLAVHDPEFSNRMHEIMSTLKGDQTRLLNRILYLLTHVNPDDLDIEAIRNIGQDHMDMSVFTSTMRVLLRTSYPKPEITSMMLSRVYLDDMWYCSEVSEVIVECIKHSDESINLITDALYKWDHERIAGLLTVLESAEELPIEFTQPIQALLSEMDFDTFIDWTSNLGYLIENNPSWIPWWIELVESLDGAEKKDELLLYIMESEDSQWVNYSLNYIKQMKMDSDAAFGLAYSLAYTENMKIEKVNGIISKLKRYDLGQIPESNWMNISELLMVIEEHGAITPDAFVWCMKAIEHGRFKSDYGSMSVIKALFKSPYLDEQARGYLIQKLIIIAKSNEHNSDHAIRILLEQRIVVNVIWERLIQEYQKDKKLDDDDIILLSKYGSDAYQMIPYLREMTAHSDLSISEAAVIALNRIRRDIDRLP